MKYLTIVLLALIQFVACQSGKKGIPDKGTNHSEEYVKGELLVGFKHENTYKIAIADLEEIEGIQFIDMLMVSPPDAIIGHFRAPKGKEKEMLVEFQKHPEVKYAELNLLSTFGALPTNNELPVLTVNGIENGKDGYTAHLGDEKNGKYTMVVSIPNLGDQYVDLKIGDRIQVEGEYAESFPVQIFAESIRIIESHKDSSDGFVKGEVEAIQNGKDGYTAKIKTADDEVYFVTISIPNLGRENSYQYRNVSVGQIIEVKGERWTMGDEERITVRAMKPAENILIVASKQVDCVGIVPQKCLLTKKMGAKDWEYFYDTIDDFEYETGYEYVLEVKREKVENPPADASSIRVILIKEISKSKRKSENLPD